MGLRSKIVISALICAILLALTGSLYVSRKPMKLVVKISNTEPITLHTFYTKRPNQDFEDRYRVATTIPAGSHQRVSIFIPSSRVVNLKLVFTTMPDMIQIHELAFKKSKIRGGGGRSTKLQFKHLESSYDNSTQTLTLKATIPQPKAISKSNQASVQTSETSTTQSTTDHNVLVSATNSDAYPTIYIEQPYRLFFAHRINLTVFWILGFISFLCSFKLVNCYLNQQHWLYSIDRPKIILLINFIFLVACFLLSLLPALKLNHETYSNKERRKLHTYAPFLKQQRLNPKYGRQFDQYFSDRFWGRNLMLGNYHQIQYLLQQHYRNYSNDFYIGLENWLFGGRSEFEPNQIQPISEQVKKLTNFASTHRIKLYMLIVPSKDYFTYQYSDLLIPPPETALQQLILSLQSIPDLTVIYPMEKLQQIAKERTTDVFFKTDHHWTETAAYATYRLLIQQMQKDFPKLSMVSLQNYATFYSSRVSAEFNRKFENGQTYYGLDINTAKLFDTQYRYYRHQNQKQLNITYLPEMSNEYYYPKGFNKRIVWLGNSFGENLMPFIPYTFRYSKRFRSNNGTAPHILSLNMQRFEQKILDFKSDILVVIIDTNNLHMLLHLYP